MAIKHTTVSQTYPRFAGITFPTKTPVAKTLTTGGGAGTLTAAETLSGLLVINCDDAQSLNLPTAALLNAELGAYAQVGLCFDVDVFNVGDTTLTMVVGTGGSATIGNSKASVLTIVALASKRFTIRITGVAMSSDPSTSNSYVVYGHGSIAAATA